MARYTIADVRKTYSRERAREEWYGDWASALIYRPLSFWVALVLLKLSVGATPATVCMIALSLSMPVAAALAGPGALVPIAFMAFACMVLDCVDGNIARATGTSTEAGAYLDFMADIVYRISIYGTVGFLADAGPASPAILSGQAFAAAALAACFALGARLCRFREGRPVALTFYSARGVAGADSSGFVPRFVFPFVSGVDRLLPLFVLAGAWWGGLGWVVLWLLAYGAVDFLYTQVVILERLRGRNRGL